MYPTLNQSKPEKLCSYLFTYKEAQEWIFEVEIFTQNQFLACEYPKRPPVALSPYVPTPSYSHHPNDDLLYPESPIQVMEGKELPESLPNSGQIQGKWWYEFLVEKREFFKAIMRFPEDLDNKELK